MTYAQSRAAVKDAVRRYAAANLQGAEAVPGRAAEAEGTRIPPRTQEAQSASQEAGITEGAVCAGLQ